jgi:poly-gamma-glutamate capsule biosynthesis protein CapA/YwtB (metallophosphatase superfamily)
MKQILKVVIIVLVVSVVLTGCSLSFFNKSRLPSESSESNQTSGNNSSTVSNSKPQPTPTPAPDIRTVNMLAVGNIYPHSPQIIQAHIGDGKYDFKPSFEYIKPRLQKADLVVADLETSQAGPDISFLGAKGYTSWPVFNSPQELSVALKDAGVDLMTLANNHSYDRGYDGLMVTLDHLRGIGVKTFGAYKSQEERDDILIENYDGINIAFIGYTFSTNAIPVPTGKEYSVNLVPFFQEYSALNTDIETARKRGADIIAVFAHWGEEYHPEPNPQYLRQVAANLAKAGADLIIGGHPKYTQPIEWFFNKNTDGSERASMVIYSQGNFLSNQYYPVLPSHLVQFHALMDISLSKDMNTGKAWISDVNYEITWVHRNWRHRILPLDEVFAGKPSDYNLKDSDIALLKDYYKRVTKTLESYGHTESKAKAQALIH